MVTTSSEATETRVLLTESLSRDSETTHVDGVRGNDPGNLSRAVADADLLILRGERGRFCVVEQHIILWACLAVCGRDPEVGGACVEDDVELLRAVRTIAVSNVVWSHARGQGHRPDSKADRLTEYRQSEEQNSLSLHLGLS